MSKAKPKPITPAGGQNDTDRIMVSNVDTNLQVVARRIVSKKTMTALMKKATKTATPKKVEPPVRWNDPNVNDPKADVEFTSGATGRSIHHLPLRQFLEQAMEPETSDRGQIEQLSEEVDVMRRILADLILTYVKPDQMTEMCQRLQKITGNYYLQNAKVQSRQFND